MHKQLTLSMQCSIRINSQGCSVSFVSCVNFFTYVVLCLQVNFWDLSGHDEFFEVRNEFYKDSQGVIIPVKYHIPYAHAHHAIHTGAYTIHTCARIHTWTQMDSSIAYIHLMHTILYTPTIEQPRALVNILGAPHS